MSTGTERPQVLVVGDPAVDWFLVPVKAADDGPNWRLCDGVHQFALPGGSLLTEHLIRQALGDRAEVAVTKTAKLEKIAPKDMVHSTVRLHWLDSGKENSEKKKGKKEGSEKGKPLFVEQSLGYAGPEVTPKWPQIPTLKAAPKVLVVDDGGNGFRHDEERVGALEDLIKSETIVVLKTTRPLFEGKLFDVLIEHGANTGNLVMVVSANDMRVIEGVKISQGFSWERTAREIMFALRRNVQLGKFDKCPHLVVRLGLDGALLISGDDERRHSLFFHKHHLERNLREKQAWVLGMSASFVASIARNLITDGIDQLHSGVGQALECARRYCMTGYRLAPPGHVAMPAFQFHDRESTHFGHCDVPDVPQESSNILSDPDPDLWRITDSEMLSNGSVVAEQIAREGPSVAFGERCVPTSRYNDLVLVDRAEIEGYAAARRLIEEYIVTDTAIPLCLGVFGPPGSGKSFGVTEIIKSMDGARIGVIPTFNVSQFRSYGDLTSAFHKIRDEVLAGRCPVVFFDEFDSEFEGKQLGWLKYFLAPMQDGTFLDGDSVYHTGKAIFVFAGGTRSSFAKFERNEPDGISIAQRDRAEQEAAVQKFREAKGPDFASRLRGFVDVMGPNRRNPADDAHILRRGLFLHAMLRKHAKSIFKKDGKQAQIDEGLCRAFLHVAAYKHGARSVEAIITMSGISGADKYVLASLPAPQQLEMHVDSEEFLWFAARERFASMLSHRDFEILTDRALTYVKGHRSLEKLSTSFDESSRIGREGALLLWIGFEINEHYNKRRCKKKETASWATPFNELPADVLRSNEDAAADFPARLREIGHGLRLAQKPKKTELSAEQLSHLAAGEHLRWNGERRTAGWRWAAEKDRAKKRSPYLIGWDELLVKYPDIAVFDSEGVEDGFVILNKLGVETFPLDSVSG